jgi:hypothetical protein
MENLLSGSAFAGRSRALETPTWRNADLTRACTLKLMRNCPGSTLLLVEAAKKALSATTETIALPLANGAFRPICGYWWIGHNDFSSWQFG